MAAQRQLIESPGARPPLQRHELTQWQVPPLRRLQQQQRGRQSNASARPLACSAEASSADQPTTGSLDVRNAVVSPVFRSTPWEAEQAEQDADRAVARIAFVSESNVCRSVLAEAAMRRLLEGSELAGQVELCSRGTRDYNAGEPPEAATLAAAAELGLAVLAGAAARVFDFEADTVRLDLVLVMDKFTAGDVMREVSVYDTINKGGRYTQKVRRLGEFHPVLGRRQETDGQDIDDPLYGNVGGEPEAEAVRQAAALIVDSCRGLLAFLQALRAEQPGGRLPALLRQKTQGMAELAWLAPPMLTPRG